jgi:hypothetical protein
MHLWVLTSAACSCPCERFACVVDLHFQDVNAWAKYYRNVQDIEQAGDYSRRALRGGDSVRPLTHAPCNLP